MFIDMSPNSLIVSLNLPIRYGITLNINEYQGADE